MDIDAEERGARLFPVQRQGLVQHGRDQLDHLPAVQAQKVHGNGQVLDAGLSWHLFFF